MTNKLDELPNWQQDENGVSVEPMTLEQLQTLVRHTKDFKERAKKLETEAAELSKTVQRNLAIIHDQMRASNMQQLKLEDCMVYLRETESYSMPQGQDRELFVAWLRENNLENILTVNHQTLNSLLKDMREKADPNQLSLGIPGVGAPRVNSIAVMK